MRYVITGCGASGTGWLAGVMTRLGSTCGHEAVHTPRGITGDADAVEGDSSWLAAPHYTDPDEEMQVLLVLRNPLHVVRSLKQIGFLRDYEPNAPDKAYADYVREHLPEVFDADDHLGRLIRYVSGWDAELFDVAGQFPVDLPEGDGWPRKASTVDVERVQKVFHYLTGRDVSAGDVQAALAAADLHTHGGERSKITWDDIIEHPDGGRLVRRAIQLEYIA